MAIVPLFATAAILGMLVSLLLLLVWLLDKSRFVATIYLFKVLSVIDFLFFAVLSINVLTKPSDTWIPVPHSMPCSWSVLLNFLSVVRSCFNLILAATRFLVIRFPCFAQLIMKPKYFYVITAVVILFSAGLNGLSNLLTWRDPANLLFIHLSFLVLGEVLPAMLVLIISYDTLRKMASTRYLSGRVRRSARLEQLPSTSTLVTQKEGDHVMIELTEVVVCRGLIFSLSVIQHLILYVVSMHTSSSARREVLESLNLTIALCPSFLYFAVSLAVVPRLRVIVLRTMRSCHTCCTNALYKKAITARDGDATHCSGSSCHQCCVSRRPQRKKINPENIPVENLPTDVLEDAGTRTVRSLVPNEQRVASPKEEAQSQHPG